MFIERYNQLFNVRPQPGSNNVDLATSFYKYLTSPRSFTTQVDQKYFYSLNQQALSNYSSTSTFICKINSHKLLFCVTARARFQTRVAR